MSLAMRVAFAILFLIFSINVISLVRRGKLLLKYSLLWLFLSFLMLICAVFPGLVYRVSELVGFGIPSNFIFFGTIIILLAIVLSLSVAVSRLLLSVKNLTQRLAILEHDIANGLSK